MSYNATAVKVMIASPSDVAVERQVVRDVLAEWNSIHSEDRHLVLMPISWETHSNPAMGDRPQEIINNQILRSCDLLVAVFWTRIGSHTGVAASGTAEEIQEHLDVSKPAMIYFSSAPVRPDSVEGEQYAALTRFKEDCRRRGLVESYESVAEFREKFSRQLAQVIIRSYPMAPSTAPAVPPLPPAPPIPPLSPTAKELLIAIAADSQGIVLRIRTMSGSAVQLGGGRNLVENQDRRTVAKWEGALEELIAEDLIRDRGHKGEVFVITDLGYQLADKLA